MNYFIKDKNTVDIKKWANFVLTHPYGNIFQTPEMFEVYSLSKKHEPMLVYVEDNNNEIVGILLAVILKEYDGFVGFFSSRSIIIGGPLIKDDNPDILDYILQEYKKQIKNKIIYSQFRNLREWEGDYISIFTKHGFIFEPHLDIIHNLNQSKAELWSNMKSSARNKVNKAERCGLIYKDLDPNKFSDDSYSLLKETYMKAELPLANKDFFTNAFRILGDSGFLKLFGAFKDNDLIAVRLELIFKKGIYDWYAGSSINANIYNPNDFLTWSVLEWGCSTNYSMFDFGGAGKPNIHYGVRDYKLKFGGELVNFGRFELVHKPLIYEMATFALKHYKLIKRVL